MQIHNLFILVTLLSPKCSTRVAKGIWCVPKYSNLVSQNAQYKKSQKNGVYGIKGLNVSKQVNKVLQMYTWLK